MVEKVKREGHIFVIFDPLLGENQRIRLNTVKCPFCELPFAVDDEYIKDNIITCPYCEERSKWKE